MIDDTPRATASSCQEANASPIGAAEQKTMRLLAVATNPATGASTRFRVLQWVPSLEAAGFALSLDTFFSPTGAETLYQPRQLVAKTAAVVSGTIQRWRTLNCAPRTADLLFIHREAFPLGQRLVMNALRRFPGPILYDYDDAMFLPQRRGRGLLGRLEDPETPKDIMQLSRVVLAGNEFLAAYARQYARRVVVLPTCIDTQRFHPAPRPRRFREPCVVGWIGSHSTVKYLQGLRTVLEAVARVVPFRLYVVGNPEPLTLRGIDVACVPWSLAREVQDVWHCDVGIYPLWDDDWSRGKCGFKAIQFMACGVPMVASAVGVNREIIEDGVNGYLASTDEEWVQKLTRLLLEPHLREQFGDAGRHTVEARYSLNAHATTLLSALRDTINGHQRDGQGMA